MKPEWLKTYKRPDGDLTRLEIQQEHVVKTSLVLGGHNDHDIVSYCHLEDCDLALKVPSKVLLIVNRFDRCTFRPRRKVNCSWNGNAWHDCTFTGRYDATHFGTTVALDDSRPWGEVLVRGCDFSQATMHFCAFRQTDLPTVRFPAWPCFTIVRPGAETTLWRQTLEGISRSFRSFISVTDEGPDAYVFHWPTFAKLLKIDLPFDEVRARLAGLPDILL